MTRVSILSLAVTDVGPLRGRVDLGELDPRLNLVAGHNEVGKSTLVSALRAALFERHGARHKGLMALQPHGTRLAPEVEVRLAVGDEVVEVRKRFVERPMAEVRIGGTLLTGDAADDRIFQLLGALPPNLRGTQGDMGLWGLLWVNQDDSAYTDPGERIQDRARGTLREVIGRQVGGVMGGRHGEGLRRKAEEHVRRFFTEKADQATGELRDARQRVGDLDREVERIEAALKEVRDLDEELTRRKAELAAHERTRPALVEEEKRARARAEQLKEERARLGVTRGEEGAARARHGEAWAQVTTRRNLVEEAEREAADAARLMEQAASLAKDQPAHEEAERVAESGGAAAERALAALRAARESALEAVRRARRAEDQARRRGVLAEAEAMIERWTAEDQALSRCVDDGTREKLLSLEGERSRAHQRVELLGTRVVVRTGTGEWAGSLAREQVVQVPGVGGLRVVPGRPGLAAAATAARHETGRLEETLGACGATTVHEARDLRASRAAAEDEVAACEKGLAVVAPAGAAALREEARRLGEGVQVLRKGLEAAREAAARCEELEARLAAGSLSDAEADRIDALSQEVAVAQAYADRVGTAVRVEALAGVTLALDDGATEAVAAGEQRRYTLARRSTVTVGDVARVTVEPGGEDPRKAASVLDGARESLRDALHRAGVSSAAEARERARTTREGSARLSVERARLDGVAPRGIGALERQAAEAGAALGRATEAMAAAEALGERLAPARATIEANSATRERIEALDALVVAAERARAEAERLAAAVSFEDPGVADGLSGRWTFLAPGERRLPGGATVEIVPGEATEDDADAAAAAERALEEALARAGAADLDEAQARWREGLGLRERRRNDETRLAALAPAGIGVLRAEVESYGPEIGPADLPALEAEAQDLGRRLDEAEAEATQARHERAATRERRVTAAALWADRQKQAEDKARAAADRAARLAEARSVDPDEAIVARLGAAEADLAARAAQLSEAERTFAAMDEELVTEAAGRAAEAIRAHDAKVESLKLENAGLVALLGERAVEGRFEELGDRVADREVARDRLAVLEREAAAARRLWIEVERAHGAALRRFLEPVVNLARPNLRALRPGTDLEMTEDFKVGRVVRDGVAEEFSALSGGTREQLSVIVRLALAQVLAGDRQPLPLILDDTLGWTDDPRFEQMINVLRRASRDIQILVLTCQPSRWEARLGAPRTIRLEQVKRVAAEAVPVPVR